MEEAPGSGIVIPGGVHTYFLDLKPGYTTPMVSGTGWLWCCPDEMYWRGGVLCVKILTSG